MRIHVQQTEAVVDCGEA